MIYTGKICEIFPTNDSLVFTNIYSHFQALHNVGVSVFNNFPEQFKV